MQIRQIDVNNARDTKRFFDFPFRLHRDTPQWVPPLTIDRKNIFGGLPFFECVSVWKM
jgi:hypothetical protein